MRFAIIVFALVCLGSMLAHAQEPGSLAHDTTAFVPSADTVRALDSAYRARKAQLDEWVHSQTATAHPQEDFISAYVGYGGYLQILPHDLNQLFSERTRPPSDLTSDRNAYSTVDRGVMIGFQAQLAQSWGIYFEYDLVEKWFNTKIDTLQSLNGATEELDLTQHSLVVGGMVVLYSSAFYRLRVNGGLGGVIALTSETESPGKYARSASAEGYQVNFDLLNDFRVAQAGQLHDRLAPPITRGHLR